MLLMLLMLQLRLNHPLSKPNELIGNEKGKGESLPVSQSDHC